jgi:hypothetical protein
MVGMKMKTTRDITLIVMFAVLIFVFRFFVGRVAGLVVGIPGFVYVFTIFYSIIHSLSFLMYKGRRWRLFTQVLLSVSLFLVFIDPTFRPNEMTILLNFLIVDVVFNSFYGYFEQREKLLWLTILFQVYYWTTYLLWILLFNVTLFFPFEAFLKNWFIPVVTVMLPIMIVEALAGGYIGYKIYQRVEKLA